MSEAQQPRDELRLPDELAACEARLAAAPLTSSTLNRDELLYRAGWAAAEAELGRRSTTPVSITPRGLRPWATAGWSAASAALAASLAVAITWSFASPPAQHPLVADAAHTASGDPEPAGVIAASVADAPSPRSIAEKLSFSRLDALIERETFPRRGMTPTALWAASRGPRVGRWDEPILVTETARTPPAPIGVEGATALELLDQVLPRGPRASAAGSSSSTSPIIEFFRPLTWGGDAI